MSQTLLEVCYFLFGAIAGGTFNALLMSKAIQNWGHFINYGMLALFFVFAVLLGIEKFKEVELSSKKLLFAYGLLGWIVAGSWMAKYIKY